MFRGGNFPRSTDSAVKTCTHASLQVLATLSPVIEPVLVIVRPSTRPRDRRAGQVEAGVDVHPERAIPLLVGQRVYRFDGVLVRRVVDKDVDRTTLA